ncbi:hypothetical protein DPEC_G00101980 [Dallia pectoralis]|uniref:Uncharacterized protein n=1 Tax=Dallia pectoralis TaxID=75939 RepID=A0ACC2GWV3_DALPE|nr:hypothetical protein DPEC_G00101980 [Dallia pectoralis]
MDFNEKDQDYKQVRTVNGGDVSTPHLGVDATWRCFNLLHVYLLFSRRDVCSVNGRDITARLITPSFN